MVELSKSDLMAAVVLTFFAGAAWMLVLIRLVSMPTKEKRDKAKGWKACVTDSGMEAKIVWTSHSTWAEESARGQAQSKTLRESRNWGAE